MSVNKNKSRMMSADMSPHGMEERLCAVAELNELCEALAAAKIGDRSGEAECSEKSFPNIEKSSCHISANM